MSTEPISLSNALNSAGKKSLNVQVRHMIRRDMPEVLQIERKSFETAWTDEDFLCCLRQRNCMGMVAQMIPDGRIVGFFIFEEHKTKFHFLNFAVHPDFRRQGVGSKMVSKLQDKVTHDGKKSEILLDVRESDLGAQLFFRKFGFRAVKVVRHHYEDTDEDAYIMQFRPDALG